MGLQRSRHMLSMRPMKTSTPYLRAFAALLLAVVVTGQATAESKRVKYVAPTGFNGFPWGELRTSPAFAQLPESPIGVGAAWMRPVQTDLTYTCMPGSALSGDLTACDTLATLQTVRRRFEGGGFYVLSEYKIEDQGARVGKGDNAVLMHPVIYQFCANWDATKSAVPPKFDEYNKFCGMRMLFKSKSREELAHLPSDHVTNYDRVFEHLVGMYGKPDRFRQRGVVTVETQDGENNDQRERKFRVWRWCPAWDRGVHTKCPASVVLSFDAESGTGMVMYSTPKIWEYAFARQNYGFKGEKLFKILHALK